MQLFINVSLWHYHVKLSSVNQLYRQPRIFFSLNLVHNEGHEIKTIEETMSMIQLENNHRKINTLEEIQVLKAVSSKYVIAGQNDPIHKLLRTSVIWTPRSTAQAKQQIQFWKQTITVISDLNSNCQQPKPGDRRNLNTHKTCWKCCINNESPTGKKYTNVGWDDRGKIGKIIN